MICLIIVVVCFVAFTSLEPLHSRCITLYSDSASTITLFSYGFLLTFAAPIIALVYLFLRALLGQRTRVKWLKWGLLGAWCTGVVLLFISGSQTLNNFKTESSRKTNNFDTAS